MLRAPLGVEFIIVLYAFAIGGCLCRLARGGLSSMWSVLLGIAVLSAVLVIPIPLLTVNRAVCPYGYFLHGPAVGVALVVTGLALQLNARRGISPSHRFLIAAGAAYPFLRLGMGVWVQ